MPKEYYCKLRLSYKGAFDAFSDNGAAALIRAILHHATGDNNIIIPDEIAPTWEIIKDDLNRDKADIGNGKKGGRPAQNDNSIKPTPTASIDQNTYTQAIKYGFSPGDAAEIGRFKNTIYYAPFVDSAMNICFEKSKTDIAYFKGILSNKADEK